MFFLEYPDSEAAQAFLEIADKIIDIVENGKAKVPGGNIELDAG